MNNEHYVLAVGDETKHRLSMLNQLYNPSSIVFLKQFVKPKMRILELACGFGVISRWFAEQVGSQGEVIAIDISEKQIDFAQKNGKSIEHLKFIEKSVYELDNLDGEFDLIFGRFILCHLTDPDNIIKQAYQKLKSNGTLACEDMVLNSVRSYPQTDTMVDYLEGHLKMYQQQGKDPNIGEKLPAKFKQAGFQEITAHYSMPFLLSLQEKKFLSETTQELKPSLIETQAYTQSQLDEILNNLAHLENDENFYFAPAATVQCAGKKNI